MLGALYKQAYASFLCLPNALRASNRVAHDGLGVKITANRREGLAAPVQGRNARQKPRSIRYARAPGQRDAAIRKGANREENPQRNVGGNSRMRVAFGLRSDGDARHQQLRCLQVDGEKPAGLVFAVRRHVRLYGRRSACDLHARRCLPQRRQLSARDAISRWQAGLRRRGAPLVQTPSSISPSGPGTERSGLRFCRCRFRRSAIPSGHRRGCPAPSARRE